MSDYTQNTTFATKDALLTGDPEKIILGADFDAEFAEIETASATKEDASGKGAASGYASLDSSTLILAAELPAATITAIGCLELATQAEAEALTVDTKYITPHSLNDVLAANGGILKDLQALADPGADKLLGWDESANDTIGFTLGAGLSFSTTTLNLASAVAGAGLQMASQVLSFDINGLVGDTPVVGDYIAFEDVGGGVDNKCTITALMTLLENNITLQEADISDLGTYLATGGTLASATLTTLASTNLSILGTGNLLKSSHGNFLYHASADYDNDQNGQITFGTGAASGGTTGDIHFTYTA